MWASGMVCTFFTFKLFDITSITNNSDIDLLAKRRLASNTPNMNSSPPSNVTVNFAGLADLMHGRNAVPNALDPIPMHPQPRHPPRISLDLFCVRYDISDNLRGKLVTLGIQGPHALRFLVDGVSVVRVSCCWVNWESCEMQRSAGRMVMVMRRTYVLVGHETVILVSIGLLQTTDFCDLDMYNNVTLRTTHIAHYM